MNTINRVTPIVSYNVAVAVLVVGMAFGLVAKVLF